MLWRADSVSMVVRGTMHNTNAKRLISLFCGVALMGSALFGSALPAMADEAPDKNGPGVARVSEISGSAVVQRGDDKQQVAAVVNAPLLPGDYISTGATSRAEIQFDGSTAVRLGGNVQARITNNDPNNRQLQVADGTIELGVVHAGTPIQIDTPSVSLRLQGAGDVRVSIGRDGSSWVTVRRGQTEVETPQRTYTLESGRTMVARGSATNPSITYTSEVAYDSFDDFSAKRDEKMMAAYNASPNLNPNIAGYDNLGQYGQWQNVAGYGQSWIPNEPSGWAPYHNGNWTWEDGYGWTWVGSEPWGWAPYHYGRWYYADGYGWAWNPPAYSSTPAWSPALVGFFGFGLSVGGAGWGASIGYGSGGYGGGYGYPYIGWCPLPPYAPYYPWYPGWAWSGYGWGYPYGGGYGWGGTRYVNITNIYNNYNHHGGSGTVVGNFQHGRISGNVITVDPHKVGRIHGIQGAVPVTPTRENLGFGGHTISAPVTMSRAFQSPRFASNRSVAARMPFERQQQAITQAFRVNAGHNNSAPVTRNDNNGRNDNTLHGQNGGRNDAPVTRDNNNRNDNNNNRNNNNRNDNNRNDNTLHGQNGGRNEPPVSNSWQRFNQDRGNSVAAHPGQQQQGFNRSPDGGRNGNADGGRVTGSGRSESGAPADSWGRFSRDRGNITGTYDRTNGAGSYNRTNGAGSYNRTNGAGSYNRTNGAGSYNRGNVNGSYNRGNVNGSYNRGNGNDSYNRGNGGYDRGSYPSYARPSNPSYSRGSGSYSSYPRGGNGGNGGGGYSAPRQPGGGGYSAPHPSGAGGGGGDRGNGGGGGRGNGGGGGGHPPQHDPQH
jgi:hypothetical protein